MITLLSPAKKLHDGPAVSGVPTTQPALLDHTQKLMKTTRKLSSKKLQDLMHISPALGDLNHARFQSFETPFTPDNARQAALTFAGDVYVGLDAANLGSDDLEWAQDKLVILSGLYGFLRPLDLMQPYRLEMGTKLKNPRGKDLYAFWREAVTQALRDALQAHAHPEVLNLASNEYFRAVAPKELGAPLVTPVFKEIKDGKSRSISFMAKKARGFMARWVIEERIDRLEPIKAFTIGDYRYNADESTDTRWVFDRQQPPPIAELRAKGLA